VVITALVARRCPFGRSGLAPVIGLPSGLAVCGFLVALPDVQPAAGHRAPAGTLNIATTVITVQVGVARFRPSAAPD
jgi:hypothetical protein